MILNVEDFRGKIILEKLIFYKPSGVVSGIIKTDKDIYEPGDNVTLSIKGYTTSNEDVYASIVVSDLSSYLKVPTFKQQPNIQDMVYLEKEIKQLNNVIDEFYYSDQFLSLTSNDHDQNLDVLLNTQSWRRGLLHDKSALR